MTAQGFPRWETLIHFLMRIHQHVTSKSDFLAAPALQVRAILLKSQPKLEPSWRLGSCTLYHTRLTLPPTSPTSRIGSGYGELFRAVDLITLRLDEIENTSEASNLKLLLQVQAFPSSYTWSPDLSWICLCSKFFSALPGLLGSRAR